MSAVLNSERAVKMSLAIIRAFVKLREMIASHTELAHRFKRVEMVQKRDGSTIQWLAEEIEDLKALPEPPPKRRIGF